MAKRVEEAAREQWLELGAVSITFSAYTGQDGKTVVDAHDHILKMMSVSARSFLGTYKTEVTQMKRLIMEYVKTLQTIANPAIPPPPGTSNEVSRKMILPKSNEGFPVLPIPWPVEEYSKQDLEELFTLYVGQHYSMDQSQLNMPNITNIGVYLELATGSRTAHVPFQAVSATQSAFINAEYLPCGLSIKNPRNMRKDMLQAFFLHVAERQRQYGPEAAFRFKAIDKSGGIVRAKYANDGADADCDTHSGRPSAKQQKCTRNKGKAPMRSNIIPLQNMNEPLLNQLILFEPTSPGPSRTEHESGYRVIDEAVMRQLWGAGVPLPVPMNGPNDGPPRYSVSSRLYEELIGSQNYRAPDDCIDPMLLNHTIPQVSTPTSALPSAITSSPAPSNSAVTLATCRAAASASIPPSALIPLSSATAGVEFNTPNPSSMRKTRQQTKKEVARKGG
ncbi:hypothetical protein BYT27DRAFT_7257783 [Phlegmacium glaucopus]|nr:hypothetical protein BYT27DRAFT_7257783 [Phlegmacium glaucopus]